ncbi:YdhK family protein [Lysinibacillus sp. 54212]|uniref:YdhK family protein n=1 Tax=Lysinibacillus sp. 54212 TaxID=3119829 RepID=UPI002FCAAE86
MKKGKYIFLLFALILTLSACNKEKTEPAQENKPSEHENMNHTGPNEAPENIQAAANPAFPVGSTAIIQADHMPGMNGEKATIVAAYDTTAYEVSYTSSTGEVVKNHKWIIHEELRNPQPAPIQPGIEVTLNAEHMEGMQGAKAVIDSAEQTTVYMVDYTSSTGEKVTKHKWVTESELSKE